MLKKIAFPVLVALVALGCSDNSKKEQDKTESLEKIEVFEEKASSKNAFKTTLQDLQELNDEQEKSIDKLESKVFEGEIIKEEPSIKNSDLKKNIQELEELNKEQEKNQDKI